MAIQRLVRFTVAVMAVSLIATATAAAQTRDPASIGDAQMLVGAMNLGGCGESLTLFSIEPGAGLDLQLDRRVAVRFGASLPTGFYDGGTGHAFRWTTGIVIPLGR